MSGLLGTGLVLLTRLSPFLSARIAACEGVSERKGEGSKSGGVKPIEVGWERAPGREGMETDQT